MSESHVFYRRADTAYPTAVSGEGAWLTDGEGRRYLDASGGAAVSCLGHGHPAVTEAIVEQVRRLPFAHSAFFTNEPAERLAAHLAERAPGRLSRVYFTSGGSEANETAIKLARQYFLERGEPRRRHFIACRQSYHGNTLGALALSGHAARRASYEPLLIDVTHIAPCYAYRHRETGESDEAYGRRAAGELEAAILKIGPENVAGFIRETVSGASLGAVPPVPGYLAELRRICDRYGVLFILDEVMCGTGRTGHLFACEADGIAPDMLTCAKALGAGYQPLGACIAADFLWDAIREGGGFHQGGFTYNGHPVACAAGLAVQRTIEAEGLLEKIRQDGALLRERLEARFGDHPHVGDIRGRGCFLGVELVADRETRRPFDPERALHARIKARAMEAGLICYPGSGTADGKAGDHVLIAPPYILTADEIGEIVDRLDTAIDAALGEIG